MDTTRYTSLKKLLLILCLAPRRPAPRRDGDASVTPSTPEIACQLGTARVASHSRLLRSRTSISHGPSIVMAGLMESPDAAPAQPHAFRTTLHYITPDVPSRLAHLSRPDGSIWSLARGGASRIMCGRGLGALAARAESTARPGVDGRQGSLESIGSKAWTGLPRDLLVGRELISPCLDLLTSSTPPSHTGVPFSRPSW